MASSLLKGNLGCGGGHPLRGRASVISPLAGAGGRTTGAGRQRAHLPSLRQARQGVTPPAHQTGSGGKHRSQHSHRAP
eukprot:450833-Alexandrium_andersonii.AAC.1